MIISTPEPLVLGAAQNTSITVDSSAFSLNSKIPGQNFVVNVNSSGVPNSTTPAIIVAASTQRVGLFISPTETLDVNGNAKVRGNLTLSGTSITISTPTTPSGPTADGLAGQIVWDENYIYICVDTNTWKRVEISDSGW